VKVGGTVQIATDSPAGFHLAQRLVEVGARWRSSTKAVRPSIASSFTRSRGS
jgi:hypothetical protein